LFVVFFAAGALVCLVTTLSLAFPQSALQPIWQLKPEARVQFQQLGVARSIALMTFVGLACGAASVGLARGREWGRRLALAILIVNVVGDSLNAFLRHDLKTLIGLPIAGLMVWYLAKNPQ
jgi:hypothetical protein